MTAALVPAGEIEEDEGTFQVVFTCTDAVGVVSQSANLNGIAVTNGQKVELEIDEETEVEIDDGILSIEAPSFLLTVTCTDAAGNVGTATAAPVFPADDE